MPHPLPPTVEEGLCQFVSIKYLESLEWDDAGSRLPPIPSEVRSAGSASNGASARGGTIAVRGSTSTGTGTGTGTVAGDRGGDPRNPLSYLGHCVVTTPTPTQQRQEPQRSSSSSSSASEAQEDKLRRRLRAYFRFAIETDESPVYGRGYRDAARCVSELTLDVVLDHVKATSSLPVI
jgi:Protein DA1